MKLIGQPVRIVVGLTVIMMGYLVGCTTHWQPPPHSKQSRVERDPLTYGTVTAKVQKGVTTQHDILQNFGAPNITTMNKDGHEVWVYDRISTVSQSDGWSEAKRFSAFFGLESIGSSSTKHSGSRTSRTSTLTVIITFDENKRVVDYSARATQF